MFAYVHVSTFNIIILRFTTLHMSRIVTVYSINVSSQNMTVAHKRVINL